MTIKNETEETLALKLATYNLNEAIKELDKARAHFNSAILQLEHVRSGQEKHHSRNRS